MPVTYMVFDLLYFKAKPLLTTPLSLRREALQTLIEQVPLPGVLVPEAVRPRGCQLFAQVERLGLEGIMAKCLDSPYLPGKRSRFWLKIKPGPEQRVLRSYGKG
jgi:ATP-dependent DNA ligase